MKRLIAALVLLPSVALADQASDVATIARACSVGAVNLPIYVDAQGFLRQWTCQQYVEHLIQTTPPGNWR